jgi:glucose uptake protein
MVLPTTFLAGLGLLILSVLAWGSWANTLKLAGKWRFELFYYDYSLGVAICGAIAAFTFGSLFPQELTFQDNLLLTGYHEIAYAMAAGAVFNLGNLLLTAAVSVSGMALAFPIAFGLALAIQGLIIFNQSNPILLFGGIVLLVIAVLTNAFAYSGYLDAQRLDAEAAALRPDPRSKSYVKPPGAAAGFALSLLSGIFLGLCYPLIDLARTGGSGVAPYGLALLFGGGVLFSTLLYLPFFINFPVRGQPLESTAYFQGTKHQHLLGLLGGVIWMAGAIVNFLTVNASAQLPGLPWTGYGLGQGAAILSGLWGLFAWREFKDANYRVKMLLTGTIVLFLTGLALITIASLHGK